MVKRSLFVGLLSAVIAAAALSQIAQAQQTFPAKPITWVVGFAPGGGMDAVTRMVAAKVAQNIGQ